MFAAVWGLLTSQILHFGYVCVTFVLSEYRVLACIWSLSWTASQPDPSHLAETTAVETTAADTMAAETTAGPYVGTRQSPETVIGDKPNTARNQRAGLELL